mgnify:CR=1 FL=1|jgi:hypothetical protein|tara:strand:+ start:479 stop:910 length:432 start_codon:yes stop_codon:yes gene_type:complete
MWNLEKFKYQSCYPKNNAQVNLKNRSHYVDDDTLKYFKSRILSSYHYADGLLFGLVESFADYEGKRKFRGVVFNIVGDLVYRLDPDYGVNNLDKAQKLMMEFISSFDAKADAVEALNSQKQWMTRDFDRAISNLTKEKATEVA